MIIGKDFIDAAYKKLFNECLKTYIRRIYAPDIAERLCTKIDYAEKAEHLAKLYNELMNMFALYQNMQQQYFNALYKNHYGNH